MPLWTNQSRALSLRMVSPTTEKRKWPGLDHPGVDRADRDLVDAGALDGAERVRAVASPNGGGSPASWRIGYQPRGPVEVADQPAGQRVAVGTMPYRSRISRSNRPAGNDSAARLGTVRVGRVERQCSSTRRSVPAGGEQVDHPQRASARRRGPATRAAGSRRQQRRGVFGAGRRRCMWRRRHGSWPMASSIARAAVRWSLHAPRQSVSSGRRCPAGRRSGPSG